jgi:DNA/RNA-binding domain of Phe-tRNA-synthetase-like protein
MNELPWNAALGVATVAGIDEIALQQTLASASNPILNPEHNSSHVLRRIKAFEDYFAENGFRSPLTPQFEMARRKGMPHSSALVDALLFSELSTGLLMGAQDAGAIRGELLYDMAVAGETFQGMRKLVQCREGEIVLRDADGIFASLFQGPDYRTRLRKETRDIVFLVFTVPGIAEDDVLAGMAAIEALFENACTHCAAELYRGKSAYQS